MVAAAALAENEWEAAEIGFKAGAIVGLAVGLAAPFWPAVFGLAPVAPTAAQRAQQAIDKIRQIPNVDCERSAIELRKVLPEGERLRFAGERLLHEAYKYKGMVLDPTAKQYVRPGVWTPEALEKAGLTKAVESGIFTPQQHEAFMAVVQRVYGG